MPRDDDRWSRDDADGRPRRRRVWDDYDPEDDYDDRPRGRRKRASDAPVVVLGAGSLVVGILALPLSIGCGGFGLLPGALGLGLGIIGFLMAHQRRTRRAGVLPMCGAAVSALAMLLSVVALVGFVRTMRQAEKDMQAEVAKAERDEAERQVERAKAPADVRAAAAGGATRVTAAEFAKAYDNDEDRFDARYRNKVLEITGAVDELDFTGDAYTVLLRSDGGAESVRCEFAKSPEVRARLARLKPDGVVTIRGKCLGGDLAIEACVLVGE